MVDLSKPRYYGPNQIRGVVVEDYKTPAGADIVRVIFEGENVPDEVMPLKAFENLVSEVPHDYNWLREFRYKELVNEMATIALEHDVMFMDVDYVANELKKKFAAAFDRTTNVLWTNDDKQFVAGIPPLSYRTLLDADRIMKEKIKSDGKE